jgi:hypothetical protein
MNQQAERAISSLAAAELSGLGLTAIDGLCFCRWSGLQCRFASLFAESLADSEEHFRQRTPSVQRLLMAAPHLMRTTPRESHRYAIC